VGGVARVRWRAACSYSVFGVDVAAVPGSRGDGAEGEVFDRRVLVLHELLAGELFEAKAVLGVLRLDLEGGLHDGQEGVDLGRRRDVDDLAAVRAQEVVVNHRLGVGLRVGAVALREGHADGVAELAGDVGDDVLVFGLRDGRVVARDDLEQEELGDVGCALVQ
jgi:hypothetical protein